MTTPKRPATAYSLCLRTMIMKEELDMAMTLRIRKMWVRPEGTSIHC